jgi:hypothetical protein
MGTSGRAYLGLEAVVAVHINPLNPEMFGILDT